jgi:hypothetical protein
MVLHLSRFYLLEGTRGEREFRVCWPLFLGVSWAFLILVPERYLKHFIPGFSFLVFGSWALLVRALLVRAFLVLGIAGPGRC